MSNDDAMLCGYRIVCDVREVTGTRIWMGKAAIVQPADKFGVERVQRIFPDSCFTSEKVALEYLVTEARKWISQQIKKPAQEFSVSADLQSDAPRRNS